MFFSLSLLCCKKRERTQFFWQHVDKQTNKLGWQREAERENKGVVNSNRDQEITERISNITRVSSKRISKSINSSNFRLLLTFNIRILQYLEKILLIVVVVAFFFSGNNLL